MGNNLHIHLKFKLKKEDIDGFSVDANEFLENTKAYIDSILGAADASHGRQLGPAASE